jgi:cell division protein FtsL
MRADQRPAGAVSAAWIGAFGASGQQIARFHRETDHRLRRAMAVALVSAAVLVGGVLGIVALKVHQVRLSYRLDALRSSKASLEERTRLLRVELATLRSLARIEGKARTELGMVPPGKNQVQLAREFVAGGSGVGAVSGHRTAAVDPPPAREARVP